MNVSGRRRSTGSPSASISNRSTSTVLSPEKLGVNVNRAQLHARSVGVAVGVQLDHRLRAARRRCRRPTTGRRPPVARRRSSGTGTGRSTASRRAPRRWCRVAVAVHLRFDVAVGPHHRTVGYVPVGGERRREHPAGRGVSKSSVNHHPVEVTVAASGACSSSSWSIGGCWTNSNPSPVSRHRREDHLRDLVHVGGDDLGGAGHEPVRRPTPAGVGRHLVHLTGQVGPDRRLPVRRPPTGRPPTGRCPTASPSAVLGRGPSGRSGWPGR